MQSNLSPMDTIELDAYLWTGPDDQIYLTRTDPGDPRDLEKEDLEHYQTQDLCGFNAIHDQMNDGRRIPTKKARKVRVTVTIEDERL